MEGRPIAVTQGTSSPLNSISITTQTTGANEECAIRFIEKVILPYIKITRERLGDPSRTAMVLFDVFKGQTTTTVHDLLEENNIMYEHIPSGRTNKLQPLDLSVNKSQQSAISERNSLLSMLKR